MFRKLAGSSLMLPIVTLGTLLSSTSFATAGTQVSITPNGFSTTPIIVISEDGQKWTKVKTTPLHLGITIGIGKTDELVLGYKIRQGWLSQSSQKPWQLVENFNNARARVDKDVTLYGGTQHFTPEERTKFIKACNAKLLNGATINQTQKFFSTAKVQMFGSFTSSLPAHQANAGGTAGKYGNGVANVQVICKGVMGGPDNVAAKQPKVLKVKTLELFRSTYKNAVTKPNPATSCKKLRILVRLKTNKAGPVQFKLWTKVGDQPMRSQTIDAWSKFSGPGEYKAEYTKWISISKTSFVQAKAEEMINPIGLSTAWKSITLKCTSGGFATKPKDDADQQSAQQPGKKPELVVRPLIKRPLVKRPPLKRPIVKRPAKEKIKTAPVRSAHMRKVACIGGKVRNNNCFCPKGSKRKIVGLKSYRCFKRIAVQKKPARLFQKKRRAGNNKPKLKIFSKFKQKGKRAR